MRQKQVRAFLLEEPIVQLVGIFISVGDDRFELPESQRLLAEDEIEFFEQLIRALAIAAFHFFQKTQKALGIA